MPIDDFEDVNTGPGLPGGKGGDFGDDDIKMADGPRANFDTPIYPPGQEPGAEIAHLILPSGTKIPFAPKLAGNSGLLGTAGTDADDDRAKIDRADGLDGAISAHHQAAQLQRDWARAFKAMKESAAPGAQGFTQKLADHYDDDVNQRIGALSLHAHEPFRAAADALRSALIGAAIPFEANARGSKVKQDIEDAASHHAEAVHHAPFLHDLSAGALRNLAGSLPGDAAMQSAYLNQAMGALIRGLLDGHVERDPDAAEAELSHPRHASLLTPELRNEYAKKIADRRKPPVVLTSSQATGPIPPLPDAKEDGPAEETARSGEPQPETDRDSAGEHKDQANNGTDQPGDSAKGNSAPATPADGARSFTDQDKAELERQLREFGAPEEDIARIIDDPEVTGMIGAAKGLQQRLKDWSLPEQPGNADLPPGVQPGSLPDAPRDRRSDGDTSDDSGNAQAGQPGTGDADKQDQERERTEANAAKPERSKFADTLLDAADVINGFDAWAERMREKYGFWADAAIFAAQVSIFGLTRVVGGILQGLALDTLFGDWIEKGRDFARDQLGKFYQDQLGISPEEAQRLVDGTLSLIEKMTGLKGGKPAPGKPRPTPPANPNRQHMVDPSGGGKGGGRDENGGNRRKRGKTEKEAATYNEENIADLRGDLYGNTGRSKHLPDDLVWHLYKGDIDARTGMGTGFHHEARLGDPPTARVRGKRSAPDANGVYQAEVEIFDPKINKWVPKERKSTFFPQDWPPARVADEINAAWADAGAKRRRFGKSPSGLEIEFGIDGNGRIISAYPVYEPRKQ